MKTLQHIKANRKTLNGGQVPTGLDRKNNIKSYAEAILGQLLYRTSPMSRHFFLVTRIPIFIIVCGVTQYI